MFLQKCKKLNLIPEGLRTKNTTNLLNSQQILNKTSQKLRDNTLQQKYKQFQFINKELNTQETIIKQYLSNITSNDTLQNELKWLNTYDKQFKEKLLKNQEKKIQKLIQQQRQTIINETTRTQNINNTKKTDNVINLSKINLSEQHLSVLSKGLKFIPTQNKCGNIGLKSDRYVYFKKLTIEISIVMMK